MGTRSLPVREVDGLVIAGVVMVFVKITWKHAATVRDSVLSHRDNRK